MATVKELQNKITSLEKTHKITSAMKLIATTKFNRSLSYVVKLKNYRTSLLEIGSALSDVLQEEGHPLTQARKEKKAHYIIVTSDRGLCGAFNQNVNRAALFSMQKEDVPFSTHFYGNRGEAFVKTQIKNGVIKSHESATSHIPHLTEVEKDGKIPDDLPSLTVSKSIANKLIQQFLNGDIDRVVLVYNFFDSTISQKPVVETMLPFSLATEISGQEKNAKNAKNSGANTLFQPNKKIILNTLIEKLISYQLYFAFLSSAVGEHAARMTAMDNASKNCEDLVDEFRLKRNRARQAAITTELVEIISGSESLKT